MNGIHDDIHAIRSTLEQRKTEIEMRINNLMLQDPYANPDRLNDNAATDIEATEESDHDRVAALILALKEERTRIDEALIRIGNNTYGICSMCGGPIAAKRLSILPTATLCQTCEITKKLP